MKSTKFLIAAGFIFAAGAVVTLVIVKPRTQQLSQDILARSREYIETLGEIPAGELSAEQKLLLLHSHHNLGHAAEVTGLAESMIPEIKALPLDRQKAMVRMVRKAYQKLGNRQKAASFPD